MPTNSCQRASTSPRRRVPSAEAVVTSLDRVVVGLVGVLAQPALGVDLLGGGVGHRVGTAGEGADRALEGLPDDHRRGRRRRRPASRARPARRRRAPAGSSPSSSTGPLGDDEQRGVLEAAAGQHPGQVGGDGADGVRRGAVEHDRHGGTALGGLAQEVPRHLVGVPGGGGDEEPEVGGGQQLGGQGAVALLDRVDVGCVEDGEALRHRLGRRPAAGRRGPWWAGRPARGRGAAGPGRTTRRPRGGGPAPGDRVVGRSTPGSVTRRPTSELTRVDLPAPVDPPTTASSGASIVISRGIT